MGPASTSPLDHRRGFRTTNSNLSKLLQSQKKFQTEFEGARRERSGCRRRHSIAHRAAPRCPSAPGDASAALAPRIRHDGLPVAHASPQDGGGARGCAPRLAALSAADACGRRCRGRRPERRAAGAGRCGAPDYAAPARRRAWGRHKGRRPARTPPWLPSSPAGVPPRAGAATRACATPRQRILTAACAWASGAEPAHQPAAQLRAAVADVLVRAAPPPEHCAL